ncbi:MAG: CRTAC1 family protein [Phycisphaerae bacterium]
MPRIPSRHIAEDREGILGPATVGFNVEVYTVRLMKMVRGALVPVCVMLLAPNESSGRPEPTAPETASQEGTKGEEGTEARRHEGESPIRNPQSAIPNPQSPGTRRMVERLQEADLQAHPRTNHYLNARRVENKRKMLRMVRDERVEVGARYHLAVELARAGKNKGAVGQCGQLETLIEEQESPVRPKARRQLRALRALALLRFAEQQNGDALHNADSCLVPIKGGGVHVVQDSSRAAIELLEAALKEDPQDMVSRWLVNLAYMNVGEHPEKVPKEWLIPEKVFDSDYDIKRFHDVAGTLGLDIAGLAGGSIIEDFDGDGYLDIMASSWGLRDQIRFFRNNRDGTFTDRTKEAGLIGITGGLNTCHADYNNDGHADVLVLRGAWLQEGGRHPNSLLKNNGDGTFSDVTEEAGALSLHPTQTAAWCDYDGDGWIDLFIGNESAPQGQHPCELYHNNGDGTFTECAAQQGVAAVGFIKGVACGDYNNDGRPDIYLSKLGGANVLYRNDGPVESAQEDGSSGESERSAEGASVRLWRFTDTSQAAGVTEPKASLGTWFWDYDNDGWMDLLVLGHGWKDVGDMAAEYLGLPHDAAHACLYHNNGDGTFTDVASAAKVDKLLLAMGCNFGDLDNDGFLDFYVGTGEPSLNALIPNRMFRNAEGKLFQDVTTSGGFGHVQKGHGIAFGDIDNDGDQDIYTVMGGMFSGDTYYNVLFENPGHGNHWVTLRLEGVQTNRAAIGARMHINVATDTGQRDIYATVSTGGSFGSSSLQQEIGLGQAKSIRFVEVFWPVTGKTQRFENVAMDQIVRIKEGQPEAVPVKLKRIVFASAKDKRPDVEPRGPDVGKIDD